MPTNCTRHKKCGSRKNRIKLRDMPVFKISPGWLLSSRTSSDLGGTPPPPFTTGSFLAFCYGIFPARVLTGVPCGRKVPPARASKGHHGNLPEDNFEPKSWGPRLRKYCGFARALPRITWNKLSARIEAGVATKRTESRFPFVKMPW